MTKINVKVSFDVNLLSWRQLFWRYLTTFEVITSRKIILLPNFLNIARIHNSTYFVKFLKKSLEPFLIKVPKTSFLGHFGPSLTVFRKMTENDGKYKKSAWYIFLALNVPYFMRNFRKIVGAVSEIIRNGRTDGRRLFYRTLRFSTGDQKSQIKILDLHC